MAHPVSHVVPPGQEGFLQNVLEAARIRDAGWTLRGARIREGVIAAGFQHRSGKVARVLLLHPVAAVHAEARTERFAVELRCDGPDATTKMLVDEVVSAVRAAESAFQWRVAGGVAEGETAHPGLAGESDRAERLTTIRALGPVVSAFLEALEGSDAAGAKQALSRIVAEAAGAPCAVTAAQVAAAAASLSGRFHEAVAWLEKAIAAAPRAMRPDLLTQAFSLHVRLGWRSEAADALGRLLAAGGEDPAVRARAARFYSEHDDPVSALPHAVAAAGLDASFWPQAALTMARAGLFDDARRTVDKAIGAASAAQDLAAGAEVMRAVGDFDVERAYLERALALDAENVTVTRRLAQLALWRGDPEAARSLANRCLEVRPDDAAGLGYRGAAAVLAGDPGSAIGDLARSLDLAPGDPEVLLSRAEALGLTGHKAEARAELDHLQSRVGANLTPLDLLRVDGRLVEGEHGGSIAAFDRDFVDKLPVGRATMDRLGLTMGGSRETPGEVIRRWVDSLRGNRSTELTTYVEGRGLRRVYDRDSARVASTVVQHLVQTRDVDDVLARFAEVVERFADKPYPLCYRAELLLWLGRNEEARRDLLQALALREDTRWAYVGLGAVELFTGHPARALERFEEGAVRARGIGPTTYAYRGECHWILGDLDRAVEDLDKACADWPNRVGARVVLALALLRRGEEEKAAAEYRRVMDLAPGLLAEASLEAGMPRPVTDGAVQQRLVLERAREMMRGNRSSSLGTWFNQAGQLRARTWGQRDGSPDEAGWLREILAQASKS